MKKRHGYLTICHADQLLHKKINCSVLHRFGLSLLTLVHWPRDTRNFHALRVLTLSSKIFTIYNNSPAVFVFRTIAIIFFLLFYDHFLN